MLRIINIDVSVAKTAWTLYDHSGYGIMFMDGDPSLVLSIAFTGNELSQSAIYIERGGLIHFPENFGFDRFYIQHLAGTGPIKLAILEKPSMDRPIYQRGGEFESGGASQLIELVNPAPSAEFAKYTLLYDCKIDLIYFKLDTDSNVGQRTAYAEISEGGSMLFVFPLCLAIDEDKLIRVCCARNYLRITTHLYYQGMILPDFIAKAGWGVQIRLGAAEAADQLSDGLIILLKR